MKTITLFFVGVFTMLSVGIYAQDYITVYPDSRYRGKGHNLHEGSFTDDQMGVGNDRISSIRVPRNMKVTVYSDNNFRGRSRTFYDDVSDLADFNDKISSIRVERSYGGGHSGGSSHGDMVTFYVDSRFRGNNQQFGNGMYNADDIGLPNDAISSIRVPSGMSVTVYTDNHRRGRSETFYSDVREMPSGFNDAISSFTVQSGYSGYRESGNRYYEDEGDPTNPNPRYSSGNNYNDDHVRLYKDCDYRGLHQDLREGSYRDHQLTLVGNDELSSLKIPYGWEVVLYADDDFRGRSITLTHNIECLEDRSFNDRVSSIRVRRR